MNSVRQVGFGIGDKLIAFIGLISIPFSLMYGVSAGDHEEAMGHPIASFHSDLIALITDNADTGKPFVYAETSAAESDSNSEEAAIVLKETFILLI